MTTQQDFYSLKVKTIKGEEKTLESYKGKVLLIVNTASKCGLTPQYQELQELHHRFSKKGLDILAFPCNQFGGQEPGSEEEIQEFCDLNYKISFPLFAKIHVNGDQTHPLYLYLKKALPGLLGSEAIKWNFTKFLIDAQGRPLKRFAPKDSPVDLIPDIEKALA